jgi:ABC-type branched-subunit amino acid transport system substrate-binding protein
VVVTADQDGGFIPAPRPPRWGLRISLAVLVVAALVAGGLWARDYFLIRCGDGVRTQGAYGECIGVTDGSYLFDDRLADVTHRIRQENDAVEKSGRPWVAVAYFEPMTLGEGDRGVDTVLEELRGAYLAQRALNSEAGGYGVTPQIKLLLANSGRRSEQWRPLVDQILGMTHGPHPVVAVAGFGQSRATTKAAVDAFRHAGVPMVGSTVTADRLSAHDPVGFFRVVAPNSQQSAAVANYLLEQQKKHHGYRVQLVKDRNNRDIYSGSLRTGFREAAKKIGLHVDTEELSFISAAGGVDNALMSVANKVCDQQDPPDAVYFAGRGRDLRRFIEAAGAGGRRCPVTVYTGDDALGVYYGIDPEDDAKAYRSFLDRWRESKVRVEFTALAHPDAATDIYAGTRNNPYTAFADDYAGVFGGSEQLLDGQAMLGYDTTLTVGKAVRGAAGKEGNDVVDTDTVRQMLVQISDESALRGVTGPIDFDEMGNPGNKPLPLVELRPTTKKAYAYLRLVRP